MADWTRGPITIAMSDTMPAAIPHSGMPLGWFALYNANGGRWVASNGVRMIESASGNIDEMTREIRAIADSDRRAHDRLVSRSTGGSET